MAVGTMSLLLAGMVLLMGSAILYQIIADRRRRDGLAAMAARRGWALEMEDRLTLAGVFHLIGRENRIRVAPRDGAAWRCEVNNWDEERENPDLDSSAELIARKGVTNFLDASCPAPAGFGVTIGPPAGTNAAQQAEHATGLPDSISVHAPDGVPEGIDMARIAAAAEAWRSRHRDAAAPVLAWWSGGVRVRLDEDAIDAARLEDFILAALQMRAAIRPAA